MNHYGSAYISEFWNYILYKHHLSPANHTSSILKIVDRLIGLHSARLSTPFVTLKVRNPDFEFHELQQLIQTERKLIKLRCMRKTLHTVSTEFADVVHTATKKLRINLCQKYYRDNKKSPQEIENLKQKIVGAIRLSGSLSNSAIIEICRTPQIDPYFIANVVKELWEDGLLCYLNLAQKIGKENRVYALSTTQYPSMCINKLETDEATEKLILTYVQQFGPVTLQDIVWWTGLGKTIIATILTQNAHQFVQLNLGSESTHYMTKEDMEEFERFKALKLPSTTSLLAYEDPTLKGYYESRFFYATPETLQKSFNSIGEVKQTMLVNGEIVGLWDWDKKQRKIQPHYFSDIEKSKRALLGDQIKKMEQFLNQNS